VDILVGICDGFHLSYDEHLTFCYMPPNHSSASNNPNPICACIMEEVAAGQFSTGFDPEDLTSCFHYYTSPLGLIDKENKFRVISDFSFPYNNPLQQFINSFSGSRWTMLLFWNVISTL